MDANREVAREALRRCMEAEFAAVGAENEPDAPSPAFAARMEKLLRQPERTPDWHRERAEWLREHMTWRVRLDYFEQVYSELVQQDR